MNMGSTLSPLFTSNRNGNSSASTAQPSAQSHPEDSGSGQLRSDVQLQFMRMMETHDLVRARLLGSSHAASYSTSGD